MERLTNKKLKTVCNGSFVHFGSDEERVKYRMLAESAPKYEEIYKKLADYEDAEEQCIKECGCGLNMVMHKYKEFLEYMHELAEYWKLEEQGLLLRLPCKVGDTIWEVGEIQPHIITKCKVDKFATDEAGVVYIKYHSDNFSAKRYLDAFGDTLFITKEEAKKKQRRSWQRWEENDMADSMAFPKTMEEFIDGYSFNDREKVYTNGIDLVPVFRVIQGFGHYEQKIRNKAIDEFAERLCNKIKAEIDDCADELDWIDEIAEQMKGE